MVDATNGADADFYIPLDPKYGLYNVIADCDTDSPDPTKCGKKGMFDTEQEAAAACTALKDQCVGYQQAPNGGNWDKWQIRATVVSAANQAHAWCPAINKKNTCVACAFGGKAVPASKCGSKVKKSTGITNWDVLGKAYGIYNVVADCDKKGADAKTCGPFDTKDAAITACKNLGAQCSGYQKAPGNGGKFSGKGPGSWVIRATVVAANGKAHAWCPTINGKHKCVACASAGKEVANTLCGSEVKCLASITKLPKVVNGNIEQVEIKDLKVGDIVQTTRGNMPISDIMKTDTRGYTHDNYVKIEKGALGENLPSEDLYITHEHSFSLGYYKNSLLNRNIYDNEQDDMVYLHITADQLADKLPGVSRVSKEFESAINLVFDEHTSINVYGLDVMMHHPKGNPYVLPEENYQDKTKFNSKVQKPLFASYDMLVNAKPEHMEMNKFLGNCITANLDSKLTLNDANSISFTPKKTMLTADLQKQLKIN